MIKRTQLSIPVVDKERRNHALSDGTSQLVVELDDKAEPMALAKLLFEQVLDAGNSLVVVFINPFRSIRGVFANRDVLAGFDCVLLPGDDLSLALEIDCEQLVLFAANTLQLARLQEIVDSTEPSWWRPSNQDIVGALTHVRELIGTVVIYERANGILDMLGDENAIRETFTRIGRERVM